MTVTGHTATTDHHTPSGISGFIIKKVRQEMPSKKLRQKSSQESNQGNQALKVETQGLDHQPQMQRISPNNKNIHQLFLPTIYAKGPNVIRFEINFIVSN